PYNRPLPRPAPPRPLPSLLPDALPISTPTPYGMTEAMPVATLDPTVPDLAGEGVCVGTPLPGVEVALRRLDGAADLGEIVVRGRSEEHTSELQSRENLVCRRLLETKKD